MEFFNTTPDEKISRYNEFIANPHKQSSIIYKGLDLAPDIDVRQTPVEYGTIGKHDLPFYNPSKSTKIKEVQDVKPDISEPDNPEDLSFEDWITHTRNSLGETVNTYLEGLKKREEAVNPYNDYKPVSHGEGYDDLVKLIGLRESTNNYGAVNPYTGRGKNEVGSGAWGRYQFIWHWFGDDIKKVTGVKSPTDFLKSPEKQDQFMKWYYDNKLTKYLAEFKKEFKDTGLDDNTIMDMFHFQGPNFQKQYREGNLDLVIGNNPSLAARMFRKHSIDDLNRSPINRLQSDRLSLLSHVK